MGGGVDELRALEGRKGLIGTNESSEMMANQRRRADPSTSSRARSAAGLAANAASRMPSSGMHSAMERLRAAVVACEQASAPRAALPAKALRCERRRTAAFVSALGDAQLLHDEARSEQLNMLKKAAGEVRPASRCSARTFYRNVSKSHAL